MSTGLSPSAEQLAREVRFILNSGTRVATIARCIPRVPSLVSLCAADITPDLPYEQAMAVCAAVRAAVLELGGGPYGQAARHLFGISDEARGLTLPRRRGLAAEALDVQVATLVRWWQGRIVEDLTTGLIQVLAGHPCPHRGRRNDVAPEAHASD